MTAKQKTRFQKLILNLIALAVVFPIPFADSVWAAEKKSAAQELAQKLPDKVLAFMATSGGESLSSSFDASIPGRLWHDPGVQSFGQQIYQAIQKKLCSDPNEATQMDDVFHLAKLALQRPMVLGVAEPTVDCNVPVYGFLLLDAGSHKDEIQASVEKIEALASEGKIVSTEVDSCHLHGITSENEAGWYWGWVDTYFFMTIMDSTTLSDTVHEIIKSLSGKEDRDRALRHLSTWNKLQDHGDALAVYIDCQRSAQVIRTAITKTGASEEDIAQIQIALRELGLMEVGSLCARVGFDGPDLVQDGVLEVRQPLRGLLAQFQSVDLAQLDIVPTQAVTTGTVNCDMASLYDVIMNTIKAAEPENDYNQAQAAIADFETKIGFKIRDELLASFAGPMVYYSIPPMVMTESPAGGIVAIADLADTARIEKSLSALGNLAATQSKGMIQIGEQQDNDRTVHTWMIAPLAMMQIMPCWTVVGEKWVFATNLPLCKATAAQINAENKGQNSIRTSEGYKKVTAILPQNLIAFQYVDSKVNFTQMMIQAQKYWPMLTMMAGQQGILLPSLLPSVENIVKDMEPTVAYTWIGEDGIYSHVKGPVVTEGASSIGVAALAVSIMMPALGRTRELARQVQCASQLSNIGKAIAMYQNDHQDKNPEKLEDLADIHAKNFVCPCSGDKLGQNSYIYRGTDLEAASPANMILAYDKAENHRSQERNVLFAGFNVEKMSEEDFQQAIEKDNEFRRKMGLPEKPADEPSEPLENPAENTSF